MILVTGGTGLVGAHLLFDLVQKGKKVRAMKRKESSLSVVEGVFRLHPDLLTKIEWVEGDINDLYSIIEALDGITEVYHSAGFISFNPAENAAMLKVNVEGTANMINLSLEKQVEKFCYLSSVAALGRSDSKSEIDENSVWTTSESNSNYAISKYSGEREVWRGAEEGLNVVIVNPSIILGPGDLNSGSSKLFRQVWKGINFYTEGVTGFVDVRDVSTCCITLMDKEIFGQRFIVNAESRSYREVLSFISEGFNKKAPTIHASQWMSEIVWRLESIRSFFTRAKPLITKETSRNSHQKWYYSNDKIKEATGINFIDVKKSVLDTCKVYSEIGMS